MLLESLGLNFYEPKTQLHVKDFANETKESFASSLDHLEFGFGCGISVLSAAWPENR